MGLHLPSFHPTDILKKVIQGTEKAAGAVVNGAEKVVGGVLDHVPGGSKIYDTFEDGVDSVAGKLGIPGFKHSGDSALDGQYLNPSDPAHPLPPTTPLDQVPAVLPNNGRKVEDTVVFVNGVGGDAANQLASMQALANTGLKVVGIHNATEGQAADVIQSAGDEIDKGDNKAVDSVRELIVDKLSKGESLHLVGHSQGGLIVARAIRDAVPELKAKLGLNDDQVKTLLGNLKVEDFGTAGHNFVDGPKYVHYVSDGDAVPNSLGVTAPGAHDGEGGKIHSLPWNPDGGLNPFNSHNFNDFMSNYRRPFDEAYADSQRYDQAYQPKPSEQITVPANARGPIAA